MNKELLISFLNALLFKEEVIKDVTYLNAEHLGTQEYDRRAVFDVYCENEKGEKFLVEMQRGGRVLKLTGRFSGISNWTDDYSVVVAGFNDKSEYAVITKSLPVNVTDGTDIVMTLGGISDEVKSLKLCVISRLRECIVEFKTMEDEELAAITDTILMDVGTLDVGMFSSIQSQVLKDV